MRFLGGFYAFPGGKVEAADGSAEAAWRAASASRARPRAPPSRRPTASAARLLGDRGARAGGGDRRASSAATRTARPVDTRDPAVPRAGGAGTPRAGRRRGARSARCSQQEGWYLDLAPFRYLSHFITPPSSPIRFTARFFLAPVPAGQEPRLLGGEASEGFWIDPGRGLIAASSRARCRWPSRRTAGSATSPGSTGSTTCGRPTPTAATSSTASSTGSRRRASPFPAARRPARASAGRHGQRGRPLRRRPGRGGPRATGPRWSRPPAPSPTPRSSASPTARPTRSARGASSRSSGWRCSWPTAPAGPPPSSGRSSSARWRSR